MTHDKLPSSETMTLEQVRDFHRKLATEHKLIPPLSEAHAAMADAIDAHLSTERREREGYRWAPVSETKDEVISMLLDLDRAIGSNASGTGIDNDKRPTDYKAGMYKAYSHCLQMVRGRIKSVDESQKAMLAAAPSHNGKKEGE